MYNEFFGFREPPFSATPNTQFFYVNDLYKEAFANLCYGIEWTKGLMVVTPVKGSKVVKAATEAGQRAAEHQLSARHGRPGFLEMRASC